MADLSIARLMTANDAYQPLRFASGQSSGLSTDAPLGAARPPTEAETRAVEAAERAPESKWFYIKRVGYNDMKLYEGKSKRNKGPHAYYVDVAAKLVGWDITLRRGGDKTGEPILHMKKSPRLLSCLGWDKGSKMKIKGPDTPAQASEAEAEAVPAAANEELNRALNSPDSVLMMPEADEQLAAEAFPGPPAASSNDSHSAPDQLTAVAGSEAAAANGLSASAYHEQQSAAPVSQAAGSSEQEDFVSAESGSDSEPLTAAGTALEDGRFEGSVTDSAMELTAAEKRELNQDFEQLNMMQRHPKYLAVLKRRNQYRSNRNLFEYRGRRYAWDYLLVFGAVHTLTDVESGEVIATCRLRPGVTTQSITAWGLRQNGTLEVLGSGLQMQDMVVATLIGMLEWRKHNNKVWIILLAAIPF